MHTHTLTRIPRITTIEQQLEHQHWSSRESTHQQGEREHQVQQQLQLANSSYSNKPTCLHDIECVVGENSPALDIGSIFPMSSSIVSLFSVSNSRASIRYSSCCCWSLCGRILHFQCQTHVLLVVSRPSHSAIDPAMAVRTRQTHVRTARVMPNKSHPYHSFRLFAGAMRALCPKRY